MKLSDVASGTMLLVECGGGFELMSKEEFMESDLFSQGACVFLGKRVHPGFDLRSAFKHMGTYIWDGWDDAVYDRLRDEPETKAFLAKVNEVLELFPLYDEGGLIEIDVEG